MCFLLLAHLRLSLQCCRVYAEVSGPKLGNFEQASTLYSFQMSRIPICKVASDHAYLELAEAALHTQGANYHKC